MCKKNENENVRKAKRMIYVYIIRIFYVLL